MAFTHHSPKAPTTFQPNVQPFWVDMKTGEGFEDAFDRLGKVDVVINCAAVSSPAACELAPIAARAINVPNALLDSLEKARKTSSMEPFLIHISTDQVYDGSKAYWSEDDQCQPVNTYGRTKLEAEDVIRRRWPHHVILRSSIIYGPQCGTPVARTLFLQMIIGALEDGKPTSFFNDEYRSPIYVQDILKVIHAAIKQREQLPASVLNMGGPDRLSRVDFARVVAEVCGFEQEGTIVSVPCRTVSRPVASPADISMNSAKLTGLGVGLTSLKDALEQMWPKSMTSNRGGEFSAASKSI